MAKTCATLTIGGTRVTLLWKKEPSKLLLHSLLSPRRCWCSGVPLPPVSTGKKTPLLGRHVGNCKDLSLPHGRAEVVHRRDTPSASQGHMSRDFALDQILSYVPQCFQSKIRNINYSVFPLFQILSFFHVLFALLAVKNKILSPSLLLALHPSSPTIRD